MSGGFKRLVDRLYQSPGLLLTLTAVFWAGNAVASRLAAGEISPFLLVCVRWLLVIGILWPLYGAELRKHWPLIRPQITSIVVLTCVGLTGFSALFYWAGHHTTAINIGILQGSMPIYVLAGAYLAHGARPSLVQVVGVLITALGVVVVATRGAPLAILGMDFNIGDLAMLVACGLYAAYTVGLRDRPAVPGAVFFTLLAVIAAVTSLPLLIGEVLIQGFSMPTVKGVLVTVWVALFPSLLAQIFYMRGIDLIGPGRAGVFVNLVPVFSAILAVTLISEPFALYHAVALALVIGGIWLAQRAKPRA
jgi:drug/metabolite transporter (DMT)-like permease